MDELWDVYDENKKKIGKTVTRDKEILENGQYHLVVTAIIMNSENKILISKRAANKKKYPLLWECNGGAVRKGENSLQGILREIKEELGIILSPREAIFLKEIKCDEAHDFKDLWLFKKDIDLSDITFPDKEAIEAKWVTINELIDMFNKGEFVPIDDFGIEEYEMALRLHTRESYKYIEKEVDVVVDRPIGSKHPKCDDYIYPVNYGYVPNIISGDGEELDCYILGVSEPVEKFKGECIAVIYRLDDNDDKLIIVPKGKDLSDSEIRNAIEFQEKYFTSEIIR